CFFRIKEISRLIELQKLPNERSGLDCGPKALELVFVRLGIRAPGEKLGQLLRVSTGGVTLEELREAAQAGRLKAWGVRLGAGEMDTVPTPFIAHTRMNHYLVVTRVSRQWVGYIDPHRGESLMRRERFERLWHGEALIFTKTSPPKMRMQLLTR